MDKLKAAQVYNTAKAEVLLRGETLPQWIEDLRNKVLQSGQNPTFQDCIYIINPNSKYNSSVEALVHPLSLKSLYGGKFIFDYLNEGCFAMTSEESYKYEKSLLEQKHHMGNTSQITEERYTEMLECIFPENWCPPTFRMSEYQTANYTAHFTKVRGLYFECILPNTTKYEDWTDYIKKNLKEILTQ